MFTKLYSCNGFILDQYNTLYICVFKYVVLFFSFKLWRTWQKITGHPCSSSSSKKKPAWDLPTMTWNTWQTGISLQGWVLYIVSMIPFTRNNLQRDPAIIVMTLTRDLQRVVIVSYSDFRKFMTTWVWFAKYIEALCLILTTFSELMKIERYVAGKEAGMSSKRNRKMYIYITYLHLYRHNYESLTNLYMVSYIIGPSNEPFLYYMIL